MRLKNILLGVVAMAGLGTLVPSSASAAFVPWTNASGTNAFVHWAGGGSTDGLWGDPTVSGLNFTFHPDQFRAESNSGVADTVDGLLRFDLDILPDANNGNQPRQLTGFRIDELGSYSILGIGSVQASGLLVVQNRDNGTQTYLDTLHSTPSFPQSVVVPFGSASGSWTGFMQVSSVANGITHVTITVDNTLQATSGAPNPSAGVPGGTSFIDKKLAGAGVTISIFIPEPSTVGLLLCGVPLLLKRRRLV